MSNNGDSLPFSVLRCGRGGVAAATFAHLDLISVANGNQASNIYTTPVDICTFTLALALTHKMHTFKQTSVIDEHNRGVKNQCNNL